MLAVVRPAPGLLARLTESDPKAALVLLDLTRDVGWLVADRDEVDAITRSGQRLSDRNYDAIAQALTAVARIANEHVVEDDDPWDVRDPGDVRNKILASPLWRTAREVGFVADDESTTTDLSAKLGRLLRFQRTVDLYDAYLLPRLISDPRNAAYATTLRHLGTLLERYGHPSVAKRVVLRGIIPTGCDVPELVNAAGQGSLGSRLRDRLADVANDLTRATGVQFAFDVRRESPTEAWFHGRYLVLDGRWVISSDRGFDYITRRSTSVANEFVRWLPRTLSPARLSNRYEQLPSISTALVT
jgi:hypothetical protein